MRYQEEFDSACDRGDDEGARRLFFEGWEDIDVNSVDEVSRTTIKWLDGCFLVQLFTLLFGRNIALLW
jgi:hypothetical protein